MSTRAKAKRSKRRKEVAYPNERSRRLARLAPSEAWAQLIRHGHVKTFPPRAEHTPMERCCSEQGHCGGRFYPAAYLTNGICEDCRVQILLEREETLRSKGIDLDLIAGRQRPSQDDPIVGKNADGATATGQTLYFDGDM
jgi:hypothetical protein